MGIPLLPSVILTKGWLIRVCLFCYFARKASKRARHRVVLYTFPPSFLSGQKSLLPEKTWLYFFDINCYYYVSCGKTLALHCFRCSGAFGLFFFIVHKIHPPRVSVMYLSPSLVIFSSSPSFVQPLSPFTTLQLQNS